MTLDEFYMSIRGWTGITDPTVHTDAMILEWAKMGQELINVDLRIDWMVDIDTALVDGGIVSVPSDWLQNDFVFAGGKEVEFLTLAEFRKRGNPKGFYTVSGRRMLFGDGIVDQQVELHYFAKVPPPSTTSSWFMENFSMLQIFATLITAFIHSEEPQKSVAAEAKVSDMIQKLNAEYNTRSPRNGTIKRRKWGGR